MAPIIIKQALQTNEYLFANTVFGCYKKEAGLLLNAMEKQHIKLSQEDQWMKKALKADYKFSDKEFAQLPQELKSKFFYCANAMGVKPLVRRLRSLGMKKVPLKIPGPPSTFAFNTDIIRTRILMRKFLKDLRKQGALLTEKEFNRLDRTQYVEKSNQIGRIQGKNFIEKLVKENGFQHIKVPKKMMVMYGNPDSLSLYIHYTGELLPNTTDHEYIKVYAERIEPVDRKLSLEEAIEWMIMRLKRQAFRISAVKISLFAKTASILSTQNLKTLNPQSLNFLTFSLLKKTA